MTPSPLRRGFARLPGPGQDLVRRWSGRVPRPVPVPSALWNTGHVGVRPVELDAVWLDRVDAIRELVEMHRDKIEADRQVPDSIGHAMRDAGFARMLVPTRLGGAGASLLSATQVVEELACIEGSVGWIAQVFTGHGRLADHMSPDASRQVFTDGSGVIAGSVQPSGVATRTHGGYRLTGRWAFASGFSLADYVVTAAKVQPTPKKSPRKVALLLPQGDVDLLDTWYVTGLRGTGSHHIEVSDVFVADEFTFPVDDVWRVLDRPGVDGRPFGEHTPPLLAAVAVGVARSALAAFCELVAEKSQRPDPHWAAKMDFVPSAVGNATAAVQSARTYLYETARTLDGVARGADDFSLQSRSACRYVVDQLITCVDQLYELAGSSAIYETSRLERCFRDVHMVSHHALVSPVAYREAGRRRLEMPDGS